MSKPRTSEIIATYGGDLQHIEGLMPKFKSNEAKRALQKLKIILNEAISSYGRQY